MEHPPGGGCPVASLGGPGDTFLEGILQKERCVLLGACARQRVSSGCVALMSISITQGRLASARFLRCDRPVLFGDK